MSSGNVFERIHSVIYPTRSISPIYNLYFDACDYEFIYHSIEKPMYKEKLRLRSYGPVDGTGKVYLELKKKCNGVVFKRRVTLSYEEAMAYLFENKFPIIN